MGKGMDIAKMAWFLVSDDEGFITGQEFVVDGGMTTKMILHIDGDYQTTKYKKA